MAEVEGWFHQFDSLPEVNLYYSDDNPDADFEDVDPGRGPRSFCLPGKH